MQNYILIENTVEKTVKMANMGKLTKSKISAYLYREDSKINRIYKIEPPKDIYFNVFGIQKCIGSGISIYFDSEYHKMRGYICILTLKSLVKEYIGITDETESLKFAAKWLIDHKAVARKTIGKIDMSPLGDIILQPCVSYEKYNGR